MAKKKRIKVGFSLHEEAYEALREMTEGPRSYGDFISALIIAERDRRYERELLITAAQRLKKIDELEKRLQALESSTKPTQNL